MALESTHMAQDVSRDLKLRSVEKMNSTTLDCFTKLVNKNESVRCDGGVTLLRHLHEHDSVSNLKINNTFEKFEAVSFKIILINKIHNFIGYT